jgi:hypothetical protein
VSRCCRAGQVQRFAALDDRKFRCQTSSAQSKPACAVGMLQRAALLIALGLILGPIYSTFWESLSGTLHESRAVDGA